MIARLTGQPQQMLRLRHKLARSKGLLLLAGDLGGTYFTLAVSELEQSQLKLIHQTKVRWAGCASFDDVLELVMPELPRHVRLSSTPVFAIGAAGSSEHGVVYLSKYPGGKFEVEAALRRRGFLGEVMLFNDFAAQARAVGTPIAHKRRVVVPGKAVPGSQQMVVGAGTGFGVGPIIPHQVHGQVLWVFPESEGGNCPALLDHICQNHEHNGNGHGFVPDIPGFIRFVEKQRMREQDKGQLRAEMFVSGRGLENAYLWVHRKELPAAEVAARLLPHAAEELNQIDRLDPALVLFSHMYGQLVRAAALFTKPLGGVFLVGGVAQKSPHLVLNAAFRRSFRMFGVHEQTLGHIPVWLLLSEETGIWGAARYAADQVLYG